MELMKTYNSWLPLAQKKIFGEEFSYETYFFLSVNNERAKAMICEIYGSKDLRIWGDNTFTELFTEAILDKESLKVGRIYEMKVVF